MRTFYSALALSIAGLAVSASADVLRIFSSGFEPSEGYSAGALAGQEGWTTFLGESPDFGRVTATNPISGSQSILLDGRDVQLGTFGNYAGVFRSVSVPTSYNGKPLGAIEMVGRAAISDPTLSDPNHFSAGNFSLWKDGFDFCTNLGPNSEYGQLTFGWELPHALPVQDGVPFEFRHRADYTTGLATQWMNGQLVYENFADAFDPTIIPNEIYFEMFAFDLLPFDTQVWYDDITVSAIYVPEPSTALLIGALACVGIAKRRCSVRRMGRHGDEHR